jgi:hypothetical protein
MPDMVDPYPAELSALVKGAYARLRRCLRTGTPVLAVPAVEWTRTLSGGSSPERYFTHPEAFPMLLLPWWFEEAVFGAPDPRFQSDLVYSTISGYYFVRMVDDLMDGERPPDAGVLPALFVFHTEFTRTYQGLFGSGDPFWDSLAASWIASAEMASRDALKGAATRAEFIETSARKTVAARIPLAAVGHRHGRTDLLGPWFRFVDMFGRWHQMLNDIAGWQNDLEHDRQTYFLSQAPGRDPAAVGAWFVRDGLSAGFGELERWMDDCIAAAPALGSPPLMAYLVSRRQGVAAQRDEMMGSLEPLLRLASTLR